MATDWNIQIPLPKGKDPLKQLKAKMGWLLSLSPKSEWSKMPESEVTEVPKKSFFDLETALCKLRSLQEHVCFCTMDQDLIVEPHVSCPKSRCVQIIVGIALADITNKKWVINV